MMAWVRLLVVLGVVLGCCCHSGHGPVVTMVTGLWNVKRGELQSGFKRTFDFYLNFFKQMLQIESNFIIFGDGELRQFVEANRNRTNTLFMERNLDYFRSKWYAPKMRAVIEATKKDPNLWQDHHYGEEPPYALPDYNPVLFSKLFLLSEALQHDPFASDYYVWVDAGLMHVEPPHLFLPRNTLEKYPLYYPGPWVYHSVEVNNPVANGFPLEGRQYNRNAKVTEFVWGGYFGGRVEAVTTVRGLFENVVRISLEAMEMWTEESLYSVMVQRYPYLLYHVHNLTIEELSHPVFHSPRHAPTEQLRQINYDRTLRTCAPAPPSPEPITLLTPAPQSTVELRREKVFVEWMASAAFQELLVDSCLVGFVALGWALLKWKTYTLKKSVDCS